MRRAVRRRDGRPSRRAEPTLGRGRGLRSLCRGESRSRILAAAGARGQGFDRGPRRGGPQFAVCAQSANRLDTIAASARSRGRHRPAGAGGLVLGEAVEVQVACRLHPSSASTSGANAVQATPQCRNRSAPAAVRRARPGVRKSRRGSGVRVRRSLHLHPAGRRTHNATREADQANISASASLPGIPVNGRYGLVAVGANDD